MDELSRCRRTNVPSARPTRDFEIFFVCCSSMNKDKFEFDVLFSFVLGRSRAPMCCLCRRRPFCLFFFFGRELDFGR